MLNQPKVNSLNKEQKREFERLTNEYDAALKVHGTYARNTNKETAKIYHQAVKAMSEFVTKHGLTR